MYPLKLLTDIITNLAQSEEDRRRLKTKPYYNTNWIDDLQNYDVEDLDFEEFCERFEIDPLSFVLMCLSNTSNTPDGEPVCGFLKTKNKLLYQTFTNALFNGKEFKPALEEANKIYLENLN